jgi:hypothetical protein
MQLTSIKVVFPRINAEIENGCARRKRRAYFLIFW